ncbi:MAG: hypothetical protein M3Q50_13890 [Chloroflexota bacterium]|nr:hypothetical protein [Chloroflexota bacterium]
MRERVMPWWTSEWTRGIGWVLFYALAVWGTSTTLSLLEPRTATQKRKDFASWAMVLIPVAVAFLIGVRLRSWWWVGGPPITTILMSLTYPAFAYLTSPRRGRQEANVGLSWAITLTLLDAVVVLLAAAAGVVCGKTIRS